MQGVDPGLITELASAEAAEDTAEAHGGDEDRGIGFRDSRELSEFGDAGVGDVESHDSKEVAKGVEEEDPHMLLEGNSTSKHYYFPQGNFSVIIFGFVFRFSVRPRSGHEQSCCPTADAETPHNPEGIFPSKVSEEKAS